MERPLRPPWIRGTASFKDKQDEMVSNRIIDLALESNTASSSEHNPQFKRGTRPPIVGREMHLDPKWSQRYSEEDNDLQKYLQSLKLRANAESDEQPGPSTSKSPDNDASVSKLKYMSKNTNYLKSTKKDPPANIKQTPVSEFQAPCNLSPTKNVRISSALLKVADLSNKYKRDIPEKSNRVSSVPKDNLEKKLQSSVESSKMYLEKNAVLSSGQNVCGVSHLIRSSKSESSLSEENIESVMNVREFSELSFLEPDKVGSERIILDLETPRLLIGTENLNSQQSVFGGSGPSNPNGSSVRSRASTPESSAILTASSASSIQEENIYSDDFDSESMQNYFESISKEAKVAVPKYLHSSNESSEPIVKQQRTITSAANPELKSHVNRAHRATQTSEKCVEIDRRLTAQPMEARGSYTKYEDPALLSRVIVGKETIEAYTTYKPAVVALNDMMRQHVQGMRLFLESQRRNYLETKHVLKPDHYYLTWADVEKSLERRRKGHTS